jgi:hypothetical protein
VAQIYPPCGLDYGSSADETNISYQMRYGTLEDAVQAINQAKSTRGDYLGCPQTEIIYDFPSTDEPTLSQIAEVWNNNIAPEISAYTMQCPRIGRYENNSALGAYYAMQAGYFTDTAVLAEIATMMYYQQYAEWNISAPSERNKGVYAYVNLPDSDPCYPGGVVGQNVQILCDNLPQYCVTYTAGAFAGANFAISGQDDANNWFDGGLAYDHGWVGVQMLEAHLLQSDPEIKLKCLESALLAGQYAISEYCVKNHNYTAKLIWLLAQLYDLTGDDEYKNELNYKLDKNLIPGILWDENNDGIVDGTNPEVYFSHLTPAAVAPGRMWDAHNSLPWYHAMNAWALTEAYVAFRDRGDDSRAAELKPYVVAMIDNLANEILYRGVITPDQLGVRDITYALLTAIWKVAQFENEDHTNWENAAWAMWNTGYFEEYSTHSVCVGLYLLVKSNTEYTPLHVRDISSVPEYLDGNKTFSFYPNPSNDEICIKSSFTDFKIDIADVNGRIIVSHKNPELIRVNGLPSGVYTLIFISDEKRQEFKLVVL